MWIIGWSVLLPGWNPNWLGDRMLLIVKYSYNWLKTTFSNTLDSTGKQEIGR